MPQAFSSSLAERATQKDMGQDAVAFLNVWIYFNLIGNTIFLPLLVGTFLFSKRVKRHPTLINVCVTWILSGIFSLLLFYADRAMPWDPNPSSALCIAQTSLLYGITPMWSVAVVVFFYYIVGVVSGTWRDADVGRTRLLVMLGAPYFVQISFTIVTLVISVSQPNRVTRQHRFFYCALKFFPLSNAMGIFTFIVCLGIIMLQVQLVTTMYRTWRGLRSAGHHTGVQILLRAVVFGIYIVFGMVVNVISMFDEHNIAPDMYAATVGTVVFLVFGTQPDVFRAWCFWRAFPQHVTQQPSQDCLDLLKSSSPKRSGQTFVDLMNATPVSPPSAAQIADHVHGLHNQTRRQL